MMLKIRQGSTWHLIDHVEKVDYTYESVHKDDLDKVEVLGVDWCTWVSQINDNIYPYYEVVYTKTNHISGHILFDDTMYLLNDNGQTIEKVRV